MICAPILIFGLILQRRSVKVEESTSPVGHLNTPLCITHDARWSHDGYMMVTRWSHDGHMMVTRWSHDGHSLHVALIQHMYAAGSVISYGALR